MGTHIKVDGTWKEISSSHVNVSGVWKDTENIYIRNSSTWKEVYSNTPPIPIGLILPLNSSIVPSGWEAFNSANNRMILGAGNTYNPGATGGTVVGSNVGSLGGNSSVAGAHDPGYDKKWFDGSSYSGGYVNIKKKHNYDNRGSHYHIGGATTISQIDRNDFKLIKSTQESDKLPINSGIFSNSSFSSLGMNVLSGNNKMFGAYSSGRELSKSGSVIFSSAGQHYHNSDSSIWAKTTGSPNYRNYMNSEGAHSPTQALTTFTQNFKRLLLSLWTHATSQLDVETGMIAMYESVTPPDGWNICDGTNSTPDLRDNFIQNCASGSENTTSQGTNQITCGINSGLSHSASHDHAPYNSWLSQNMTVSYTQHGSYSWSQNKIFNFLPSYYALSFIMKA